MVDESRQSREDVEATVLTAITGIGADSLGACASPESQRWKCVCGAMLQLGHSGGVAF